MSKVIWMEDTMNLLSSMNKPEDMREFVSSGEIKSVNNQMYLVTEDDTKQEGFDNTTIDDPDDLEETSPDSTPQT